MKKIALSSLLIGAVFVSPVFAVLDQSHIDFSFINADITLIFLAILGVSFLVLSFSSIRYLIDPDRKLDREYNKAFPNDLRREYSGSKDARKKKIQEYKKQAIANKKDSNSISKSVLVKKLSGDRVIKISRYDRIKKLKDRRKELKDQNYNQHKTKEFSTSFQMKGRVKSPTSFKMKGRDRKRFDNDTKKSRHSEFFNTTYSSRELYDSSKHGEMTKEEKEIFGDFVPVVVDGEKVFF